jgi:hypothetical protein
MSELFARQADNTMYHIWQSLPNQSWSDWLCVKGLIDMKIAIVQNKDEQTRSICTQ